MSRLLLIALALATSVAAADVSRWVGTIEADGAALPVSLCLMAQPDAGSIALGDMRYAARIENVTATADRLAFIAYDSRNRLVTFELKPSSDQMAGEAVVDGMASHVVLSPAPEPFPSSRSHTVATATHTVKPTYTDEARAAQFEGTVLLSVEIDANGVPQNIQVKRAVGLGLDEKAVQCVRQWRFKPALNGDAPILSTANIEVNFRL